jgi:hypothetical protein
VRLTTSHRKTLLLWNLNRGGQGPIWAVAPMDGWMNLCIFVRSIGRASDESIDIDQVIVKTVRFIECYVLF